MGCNDCGMAQDVEIVDAVTREQLDAARALFREYAASLPFPLDYQGFDAELAALPGKYAAPGGCIVLAKWRGAWVGCIAMRPLDASGYRAGDATPACEMKRMYVQPRARGLKLGRLLGEALLERAKAAGYRCMKLDTEDDFVAACALYRALGFIACERYNDDPLPGTIWMKREW
jgi:GNAT superfamily N-acetyltransferase